MKRRLLWCIPWVFVAGAAPAQAERSYATDLCTVPVQSGAAPAYKILRMVSSGTSLEILEPNIQGYTKVKTPEGTVGWIMTQYLMDQPSARSRLGQLEARVATLENENRVLRGDAEALGAARDASTRCGEELTAVRRTASQTLAINEENRRLQEEVATARERQSQLELENATLRDQSHRNWFVAGAGAVFGGLLCGLVIPRLSWGRRRRSWDQF
ncbi:MAG: TIGR04211 family SH3 domain-containing protein [Candidatus Contendobacter sp.]|nr:MAG: TIGR04211 family SH3 domain-containing protein [Candidatus Contendobacter sp.]